MDQLKLEVFFKKFSSLQRKGEKQ